MLRSSFGCAGDNFNRNKSLAQKVNKINKCGFNNSSYVRKILTSLANTMACQSKLSISAKAYFEEEQKLLKWNWIHAGIAVYVISMLNEH